MSVHVLKNFLCCLLTSNTLQIDSRNQDFQAKYKHTNRIQDYKAIKCDK